MSKLFSAILIVAFLSGVFAGCGGKIEETYQMVTLREAGHSGIISPGFKFSFDTPKFIAVSGNIGMVREDNLIEFFTGQDLENKLKMVEGKRFVAGVTKSFSPEVHFSVDFLVAGGDTIHVGTAYNVEFPTLLKGFDEGNFEEIDTDALTSNRTKLKDIFDTRFKIEGVKVTHEEILDAKGEPMTAYIVNLPKVRFILEEIDPGMELLLKALINENTLVSGGLSYGGAPSPTDFPRSYRERTKIGGMATLEYLKYAGEVCPVIQ